MFNCLNCSKTGVFSVAIPPEMRYNKVGSDPKTWCLGLVFRFFQKNVNKTARFPVLQTDQAERSLHTTKTEGSRMRKEMKKVESMKEKKETQKEQIPPELVAKAKAGDQAAFSELYQQTSTVLYRSIRSMVHDEDLAWDILQDSYLRAYKSLDQLENNAAFLSWLRRISVNVTATQMSKRLPTPFSSLSGEDGEQPELPDLSVDTQPELALDKKETSRLVQEILAELSEEQQLIIGMRYYEELSVKEISELLKIAPGTVRAQLFRGRKRVETAVRALEKKGVKLYGLSPLPFFLALLRQTEPAKDAARAARKAVLAKTAESGIAQAATITAYSSGHVLRGMLAKLALGILAVGVVGCGIWACGKLLYRDVPVFPYQPSGTEAILRPGPEESLEASGTYLEEQPPVTEAPTPEPTEHEEPEAPDAPLSGTCGEHLTWSFDPESGALNIKGEGEMRNYDAEAQRAPWYPYHELITYIRLPGALTTIGSYAFQNCTQIGSLYLPDGLTSIGEEAFSQCSSLVVRNVQSELQEIGSGAFRNCGELRLFIGSAELRSIGDAAFSGCTSLEELRLFNRDCVIGAELGATAETTICGFPDSSAERYAVEHGYPFDPIVEADLDTIMQLLTQIQQEQEELEAANPELLYTPLYPSFPQVDAIQQIGTRYLAKLVRSDAIFATEEDLAQAKLNGEILLNGKHYRYTDSLSQVWEWLAALPEVSAGFYSQAEMAKNLGLPSEESETTGYGWIQSDSDSGLFSVQQAGDQYYFGVMTNYNTGFESTWLVNISPLAWVWLEPDTPVYSLWDEAPTLETFLSLIDIVPEYRNVCGLRIGDNGELVFAYYAAGF